MGPLLRPHVGQVRITELRARHVTALDDELHAAGLSVTTRNKHARALLRQVLAHAKRYADLGVTTDAVDRAEPVRTDVATVTPKRKRNAERASTPKPKALEPEQIRALVAASVDDRWHTLVATLAETGMRQGEVRALGWDAIDLDAAEVTVARAFSSVQRPGERATDVLTAPKTARAVRTIGLSAGLVTLLRAWRATTAAERLAVGASYTPDPTDSAGATCPLVFVDPVGAPVTVGQIRAMLKRASVAIGLPRPVNAHLLRHSSGSYMAAEGIPVVDIAERLGHSDPAFTIRTYVHPLAEGRKRAAAAAAVAIGL